MTTQQDSIDERLTRLETDMAEVKSDMAEVKSDMAEVKSDMAEVKSDVAEVKGDVANLESLMGEFVVVQTQMLDMLEHVNRRTEDIALHMGVPKRNGTA